MRNSISKLHHHGKAIYEHAQKHHKKYFWGAAGFFGLFKLFSFLILSIVTYTSANTITTAYTYIEVPTVHIQTQDGKNIIQLNFSGIDFTNYTNIKNINLHLNIESTNESLDLTTLRDNKEDMILSTNGIQTLDIKILNIEKNIRTIDTKDISLIVGQLLRGNTIGYFLFEEISIQDGSVFMEMEIQESISIDTGVIDTGVIDTGIIDTGVIDMPVTNIWVYNTGVIDTGTNSNCGNYEKKKNCENDEGCIRNEESKICNEKQIIEAKEKHQIDVIDPNNIQTDKEIEVRSDKNIQHMSGYIRISKQTKIKTDKKNITNIQIQAPSLITDPNLQGTPPKEGIPDNFIPIETIQVGDPTLHITVDTGSSGFVVSMEIVNISMIPDTVLNVYTSPDGVIWENLNTTCIVDSQNMCTFTTPHLTLFTVGTINTITWNNLEFVTQNFRSANPNTGQIIDAFFGTGGNPSAYTTHRNTSTGCRTAVTGLVYRTGATRPAITLNANTIYVLYSGNYIQTGSITMSSCSALVGSGTVTITKTAALNIITNVANASGMIVDNLQLNGTGISNHGIYFITSNNTTINDVQSYHHGSYGIHVISSNRTLINNSQTFRNASAAIYVSGVTGAIINNCQSYTNGRGIYSFNNSGITINNSQVYNNSAGNALNVTNTKGLVINNIQSYNNSGYGINLSNSPNVKINNSRIFNNVGTQVFSTAGSSGRYYGDNIAYPTAGFASFTSSTDVGLGWTAGTLTTTDLGSGCDFVTEPFNGLGIGMYTTNSCNDIGYQATWTGTEIVEYLYGNNMSGGKYVLRQAQPVYRTIGGTLVNSTIPYNGHRFIGEYYDPSGRDLNIPIVVFITGTTQTPPQGTNVYTGVYSGSFTGVAYIYEPNLYSASRFETINSTTPTYNIIYDNTLIFMANFDSVADIGEIKPLVKDLSLTRNFGTSSGSLTGNGRWNSAYDFITGKYIEFPDNNAYTLTGDYTFAVWINPNPSNVDRGIMGTYSGASQGFIVSLMAGDTFDVNISGTRYNGPSVSDSDGLRKHLVFTREGNTGYFYLNGVFQNSTGGKAGSNGGALRIGQGGISRPYMFTGRIDEPRIYNRALTSAEINHIYHSNLSAKGDHREYIVNYTGVNAWLYGTHTFGFNSSLISDIDGNQLATATTYVVKYQNCTGSLINWNNNNLITGAFWDNNPGYCDIVFALYGTGTSGQDTTAYTSNRFTGGGVGDWSGNCNYQNMNVVYVTGGVNKLPLGYLTGYTIYVLSSGTYIQSGTIDMDICTTIIGTTGNIKLYSTGTVTNMMYLHKYYNIVDNIQIDGTGNGIGGVHAANDNGIYMYNDISNTINDNIIRYHGVRGIFMSNAKNNKISNNDISKNIGCGIYIGEGSNDNMIESNKIYKTQYSAGGYGAIHNLAGLNNIFSGLQIFNNGGAGLYFQSTSTGKVINSQFYDNVGEGINIINTNDHITINNIQSYNNKYGIYINSDTFYKDYITINNSQLYNNSDDGLQANYTRYLTINNTHIYNNAKNGINFNGSYNNSGILNNVFAYNNGTYGIYSASGVHTRYGKTTMFNNTILNINRVAGSITAGLYSTYSSLGRTGGTTDTTPCMSCARVTNPKDTTYIDVINTTTYPKCTMTGANSTWVDMTGDMNYTYGINITGQVLPVIWSDTTLITGANLGYTTTKHVAEINPLSPDYTNAYCTCAGTGYGTRNNNNFITGGFWDTNPTYCQIIAALYGTSTTGSDRTAYTQNRTGMFAPRSGECNVENMEVRYLTGGTGKINFGLSTNIIYVLDSGNYIQTGTINTNLCNVIIGRTGTISLYSTGEIDIYGYGMIYVAGSNTSIYNIFDNFAIDGANYPGGTHTGNGYGINIYGIFDVAINNISSSNNQYGIRSAITQYSSITNSKIFGNGSGFAGGAGILLDNNTQNCVIENTEVFNNAYYGINMNYQPNCIYINNSQIYNNGSHGVRYYYRGLKNTLNNTQIYNNSGNGIRYIQNDNIASSGNLINNVNIYNNQEAGVYFENTENIGINNFMIYNNGGGGIYMDVNSPNNKFYGSGMVFGNEGGNITGTITNLITGNATDGLVNGLGRTTGTIAQTPTMSWDYITLPVNGGNIASMFSLTGYTFTGIIGRRTYNFTLPMKYSYGSGILTQRQPVINSGYASFKTGGTFSGSNFIGGNIFKITGDLLLSGSSTTISGITLTGISNATSLVSKYSIQGNVISKPNININSSTGIFLDDSVLGIKNIVAILYTGFVNGYSTYFGMHFQKNITLRNYIACLTGWNNDFFINASFWAQNPTTGNIICALYGTTTDTGTAYTKNRYGYTGIDTMSVVYIQPGTGTIPRILSGNTIYVAAGGNYIYTGTTVAVTAADGYSAIIGTGKVMMYSTGGISTGTINITSWNNILDNININGSGGGPVPAHTKNYNGIVISSILNTLNNIDIYNHQSKGINILASYNIINNTKVYNNDYGIALWAGWNSIGNIVINNTLVYNNTNGIYGFADADEWDRMDCGGSYIGGYLNYTTINNTQVFNNTQGILLAGRIDSTTIYNSEIYNNGNGISADPVMSPTCVLPYNPGQINLASSKIYNNTTGIVATNVTVSMKYYGTGVVTGNTTNVITPANFVTGGYVSTCAVCTTGSLVNIIPSFDYFTNPLNGSGNYMVSWGYTGMDTYRGIKTSWNAIYPTTYSLGGIGIIPQLQPVQYLGTNISFYGTGNSSSLTGEGDRDTGQFIGSETHIISGSVIISGGNTAYTSGITVVFTSAVAAQRRLYGDVFTERSGTIAAGVNITTGLFLSGIDGNKNIFLQLWTGTDFATHYLATTNLNTTITCASRWSNENFITGAFWTSGTPTNNNIICALYGTGPGDTTAYTNLWSGRDTTQCSGINISVIYTGNLALTTLASNTIYVVTGSIDTGNAATINLATCSAIISNQTTGTTFYTDGYLGGAFGSNTQFFISSKQYTIFDNIGVNATGGGPVPTHAANQWGIHYNSALNNTINNSQIYNTSVIGIRYQSALNNLLVNSQIYNNSYGIYYIYTGKNNIINNSQFYNNTAAGVLYQNANTNNTINNSQIYNNTYGIRYYTTSTGNILNNSQIYNNGTGVEYIAGNNDNSFNNSQFYNNRIGIDDNASNILYYGTSTFFNNIISNTGGTTNITQGTGTYYSILGWTTGSLITTGTMSRDYITIPSNSGAVLFQITGNIPPFSGMIGPQTFLIEDILTRYSYGSGILTQTQPVYYTGTTLKTGGLFTSTKFIGSDLTKITGDLLLPSSTTTSGITVTGTAGSPLVTKYRIFGNISSIVGGITLGTSTGIYLDTTTLGTKRIITQLYAPSYYSMHFEHTTELIDPCLSGWNNDNFIDSTFRAQNPTDANIICALYGSGGNDQTAYTRTWSGGTYDHTACLDVGMNVVYATNPNTTPLTSMGSNRIYIFPSGTYTLGNILRLKPCVTFISSGNVVINSNSSNYYFRITDNPFNIIDNIDFNGMGTSMYGLLFENTNIKGSTLHSMDIYNTTYGVDINGSLYNLIDGNTMYSNTDGIYIENSSTNNVINNNNLHTNGGPGIYILNSNTNLISNTLSYNNGDVGIGIDTSDFTTINNSKAYNHMNAVGLRVSSSSSTTINNSQTYNNMGGISLINGGYTTINNTLVYNNNGEGISNVNGIRNVINNSDIFNNSNYGINEDMDCSNGIIANTRIYNNGNCGYNRNTNVTYYSNIHVVNNGGGDFCSTDLTQGLAVTYPDYGWNDGNLYDSDGSSVGIGGTGSSMILSRDYFMNPLDTNGYLLLRNPTYSSLRGIQGGFTALSPTTYSYGSGILPQAQAVLWDSNPILLTGLTFDATRYIGSGELIYTGNLIFPSTTITTGMTVTGQASTTQISGYNIYGLDLFSTYLGTTINNKTGIFLTAGDGIKKIITQIYAPNYFATHFENNTTLNTTIDCASRWSNENFITGAFWTAGTPTNDNIICALYGTGPNDPTAYTQLWSGRDTTQCSGTAINVVYTGNLNLTGLAKNTIYVMTGSISTGGVEGITTTNCSAIISNQSAGTIFYSTGQLTNNRGSMIVNDSINSNYVIFDNIAINGTGGGPVPAHTANMAGIYLAGTDITTNNCKIYNNIDGISLGGLTNSIINNTQTYNNNNAGIGIDESVKDILINNIQSYNNGSFGIYFAKGNQIAVNNSQVYNNSSYGIYFNVTANNSINNSQIYNNNSMGIVFGINGTNTIINNTRIYNNNGTGIYLYAGGTNNKYYGTNKLFNNVGGDVGGTTTNFTTGSSADYSGILTTGSLITIGIMSFDYITNPINIQNNYLIPWTGLWTGIQGIQTNYINTITNKYSYGSGIIVQIQSILRSGSSAVKTGGIFTTTKYIGSDILKYTGDILGISGFSTTSGLLVTGIANAGQIGRYNIFGDIIANISGRTINQNTGIYLTTTNTSKRIITQLVNTDYFATHFQRNTFLDATPPNQVILISPLSGSVIPNSTVALVRSAAIDTGIGMGTYRYEVSTGIGFTTFITSGTTANTGTTLTSLAIGTTYYWRVYAIDLAGNTGLWSEIWNFRIDIPIECSVGRDNEKFIDDSFRALNPNDQNIICALYGSGGSDQTAYTQLWSGYNQSSCLDQGMVVSHKTPGTGKIDYNMNHNTIYVLSSGNYIQTGTINIGSCNAIVGQTGNIILYSTITLANNAMLRSDREQYNIFDHLGINGTGGGPVPAHEGNRWGIYIKESPNNTINNNQIYNNSFAGIEWYSGANYNSIHNSKVYNNISVNVYNWSSSHHNVISNSQFYNSNAGVQLYLASRFTINNIQSYNNTSHGLQLYNSSNNTINNSQFYNNTLKGIDFYSSSTGNNINAIGAYNNGDYGISTDLSSTGNIYYGTSYFFGNLTDIRIGSAFTGGTGTYFANLGWTTGAMVTGITMSRDYITNPNTGNNYLVPWTGIWTGIQGNIIGYATTVTDKYSYGSGIFMQKQQLYYSGTTLKTGRLFSGSQYIGSNTVKVTGDLLGRNTNSMTMNVSGSSVNGLITKYSLFGNILVQKTGLTINSTTGITLTGTSTKRVITQLYDPTGYFATHFEHSSDFTATACTIQFTGTTPTAGATLTGNNFAPQLDISNCIIGIDTFNYTFNGITYPYYDSGLVLMMNFDKVSALSETDGLIKDLSQYGNNGSGYNGVTWTGNGRWNSGYSFDGSNDKITVLDSSSLDINNKITIALWFNQRLNGGYQGIIAKGYNIGSYSIHTRDGLNSIWFTLEDTSNTPHYCTSPNNVYNTGVRNYMVATYDGSMQRIFINGNEICSGSVGSFAIRSGTDNLEIGVLPGWNYFNGLIDEPRIRNRALSSGEIVQMRRSNFAKYDTGNWLFTDDRQCMVSNTYTYTGYLLNNFAMTSTTGRTNTINIANRNITAPTGYSLGSTGFSYSSRILTGQWTGFFEVSDWKGNSGRYTTIQTPLRMTGTSYGGYLDYNNIYFMATGVNTITGALNINSAVYVTGTLGTYQTGNNPKTYIIRDYVAPIQYSCPAGIYQNKPYVNISLPGWQNPDVYSGYINIYLYE